MTTAYLNLAEFKLRTVMPSEYVDALEKREPGWVAAQLEQFSAQLDGQLSKRYAVPFAAPYPEVVKRWLSELVTYRCFRKRGWDPADDEAVQSKVDYETAEKQVQEAADSEKGLWDLPLANGSSGISKGRPKAYSEASPYVWMDGQAATGRDEDRAGGGTSG